MSGSPQSYHEHGVPLVPIAADGAFEGYQGGSLQGGCPRLAVRGGVINLSKSCYQRGGCTRPALKLAAAAAAGGSPNPSLTNGPPQLCSNCCRRLCWSQPASALMSNKTSKEVRQAHPLAAVGVGYTPAEDRGAAAAAATAPWKTPPPAKVLLLPRGGGGPPPGEKGLQEQPRLGEPFRKENERHPGTCKEVRYKCTFRWIVDHQAGCKAAARRHRRRLTSS